tara:strand:+ start:331 stop:498 length:168 start_codon:yes stop_codon:yes gene_type:complete
MRNRQRQRVEATRDEEVVHAPVLAPSTIPDTHINGVLVYNPDSIDLALCELALPI